MDNRTISKEFIILFINPMSTESLNRTSEIIETPSQIISSSSRVNVDVLKQRLLREKKKEKVKRTIIFSSVLVSLGALTILTY